MSRTNCLSKTRKAARSRLPSLRRARSCCSNTAVSPARSTALFASVCAPPATDHWLLSSYVPSLPFCNRFEGIAACRPFAFCWVWKTLLMLRRACGPVPAAFCISRVLSHLHWIALTEAAPYSVHKESNFRSEHKLLHLPCAQGI